jgi:putative sigma-54 modulation protein
MQVSVTFRHMDASDPLKKHAIEKVAHIKKYLDDAADAHVVLSIDRYMHKADVNLSSNGLMIRGEDTSGDMYNSIDRAIEKIERQVKRYRHKLTTHRPREGARLKIQLKKLEGQENHDSEIASGLSPNIVETKELQARPMMLDEAVMQMDLLHNDVLVFVNSKTDQINVLYRKKGNQYGLIETNAV